NGVAPHSLSSKDSTMSDHPQPASRDSSGNPQRAMPSGGPSRRGLVVFLGAAAALVVAGFFVLPAILPGHKEEARKVAVAKSIESKSYESKAPMKDGKLSVENTFRRDERAAGHAVGDYAAQSNDPTSTTTASPIAESKPYQPETKPSPSTPVPGPAPTSRPAPTPPDAKIREHLDGSERTKTPVRLEAVPGDRPASEIAPVEKPAENKEGEKANDLGRGPGQGGDRYVPIYENPFYDARKEPLSTFSIDVDSASYAKVRRYLMDTRSLPPPDAVRIEELVNYFPYNYAPPSGDQPFAVHLEAASCPWKKEHRLVRIGLKGKQIDENNRPSSNLVFLIDVSGSMSSDDRLPRIKRSLKKMVQKLGENDRVAIVVYAAASGLVLPSTTCNKQSEILASLENLQSGGSTNGGAGIQLAYQTAKANFIKGGTNRVLLCTDGDFNVGTTSNDQLVRMIEQEAKSNVFFTVLGFGMGNHNDAMLEQIADKGNGTHHYIDTDREADRVLIEQMGSTLITIAKDVKIQVEFNPAQVAAYRLVGYENRILAAQDFNDDKKDAGEIGAGHTVTALYEIVPAGLPVPAAKIDDLKYQKTPASSDKEQSPELLTVKLRYKQPEGDKSDKIEFSLTDKGTAFDKSSDDFQFATAVASFGLMLRHSQYKGSMTWDGALEIASGAKSNDPHGYKAEFLELVKRAKELSGK
ncbi:MAG: von Willebrand factor type A domain-containing protein, partial [Pirellulaceae bacterium]